MKKSYEIDLEDVNPLYRGLLLGFIICIIIFGMFYIGFKVGANDMCSDIGGVSYKNKGTGKLVCVNHSSLDYCVDRYNGGMRPILNESINLSWSK